jgi:hypothetical protein
MRSFTCHSLCLMSFLMVATQTVVAQNVTNAEPEFVGVALLLGEGDAAPQKLEKQKASMASRANVGAAILGIAKAKGMNIVRGGRSPVRTTEKSKVRLIVRVSDNSKDPVEVINVFQLEEDKAKDQRVLIVGKVNFNAASSLDIKFFQFKASKYGTSSFLIELSDVHPGEYALTLEESRGVFNLFGVD